MRASPIVKSTALSHISTSVTRALEPPSGLIPDFVHPVSQVTIAVAIGTIAVVVRCWLGGDGGIWEGKSGVRREGLRKGGIGASEK